MEQKNDIWELLRAEAKHQCPMTEEELANAIRRAEQQPKGDGAEAKARGEDLPPTRKALHSTLRFVAAACLLATVATPLWLHQTNRGTENIRYGNQRIVFHCSDSCTPEASINILNNVLSLS